ncbi:GNAT family N-acetyltransferase [Mucilaginibacter myungsuensis]|uniref:GNAT family N-acetyltransferase n=1 Tax=Mucilaginibacter myungsuensis TaxID=649104 RepID=A0A929KYI8_9SPHI|nr:GNAT family N-acetyltransferase [Mucilaginibacter myungsuensis]MBE9664029.1 GNAT family N-acetyltransferase [Mucilaginibacter myungsuensis]MDN3601208.1 GNAT family N-acetyltransferase [Mucilaginibacter myungsuensis]
METSIKPTLNIIDYKPEYQPYFERFNKAWLEKYFTVEPLDKYVLENPEEAMIDHGGKVYFVTDDDKIVGTVALRYIETGCYELTKMAVDENFRGHGIGQYLCQAGIDKARDLGVERLILFSNRVLANAIHIYHKLGFTEIPVQPGTYGRADIMMEINFKEQDASILHT